MSAEIKEEEGEEEEELQLCLQTGLIVCLALGEPAAPHDVS